MDFAENISKDDYFIRCSTPLFYILCFYREYLSYCSTLEARVNTLGLGLHQRLGSVQTGRTLDTFHDSSCWTESAETISK